MGKAMRAIALDQDTCKLMGINIYQVIGITFVIGSALAAIAGGMSCVYYGSVVYYMGYNIGIKAFTSAVIGGVGSIPGAKGAWRTFAWHFRIFRNSNSWFAMERCFCLWITYCYINFAAKWLVR